MFYMLVLFLNMQIFNKFKWFNSLSIFTANLINFRDLSFKILLSGLEMLQSDFILHWFFIAIIVTPLSRQMYFALHFQMLYYLYLKT